MRLISVYTEFDSLGLDQFHHPILNVVIVDFIKSGNSRDAPCKRGLSLAPKMHLLLVGLARGPQNRVIRVQVLSDAPTPFEGCALSMKDGSLRTCRERQNYKCSYSLMDKMSVYGTEVGGSTPLASTKSASNLITERETQLD